MASYGTQPEYYPPPAGVPSGNPPPHFQAQLAEGPWSTGICDCGDDCSNCCITFWCPCVTFGKVAEIIDKGSTSCGASGALYTLIMMLTGLACFYSCFYRTKMRRQYGLKEDPCHDCCVHWCCEMCSLCQMYRELKRRGFDMTMGWHANAENHGQMVQVPPPVQGMSRY